MSSTQAALMCTSLAAGLPLLLRRRLRDSSTQNRRLTQGRAGDGRSGVNGAPLRAGRTGSAGLRAAEAVPGRDPRVLPRRLPLRPPRRLARLRYDYSICSCICRDQSPTCSSVTSPRIPVLPLRTEIQIPVSKVGILPSALVGFTVGGSLEMYSTARPKIGGTGRNF